MEELFPLFHLTVVMLLGLLFGLISARARLPLELPLLLTGLVLGALTYNGEPLIQIPAFITVALAVSALVLVTFDTFTRFRLREWDSLTKLSLKLSVATFIITILAAVLFSMAVLRLGLLQSLILGSLIATITVGQFSHKPSHVLHLLRHESLFSSMAAIVLVLMLYDALAGSFSASLPVLAWSSIVRLVTGCAAGTFLAVILFNLYRKQYIRTLSPILLVVAVVISYIAGELIGGSGVAAVAVIGLFYGNFTIQHKKVLSEHTAKLSNSLLMLVFMFFGLALHIRFALAQLYQAALLLVVLLVVRWFAVYASTYGSTLSSRERLMLTVHAPRGAATIVLAYSILALSGAQEGTVHSMLVLMVLFVVLTQAIDTILTHTRQGSL